MTGRPHAVLALTLALVSACAEHKSPAPADDVVEAPALEPAPAPAPKPAPARPLSKWVPEQAKDRVHEMAFHGRLWIHPRGRKAVFVNTVGQRLVLEHLPKDYVALHGRAARADGWVQKCGGSWWLRPTRIRALEEPFVTAEYTGEVETKKRDKWGRVIEPPIPTPPLPQISTRAQLETAVAPWVQVTGKIAGFWQRRSSGGAYVRLADGYKLKVYDLPATEPLRRVVRGDLVTISVELHELEARAQGTYTNPRGDKYVKLLGACEGEQPRCGVQKIEFYPAKKPPTPPSPCEQTEKVPNYAPQMIRDFSVDKPRRRPMPSVECQYPRKRRRPECLL